MLKREVLDTEIGKLKTVVIAPILTVDGVFTPVGEIKMWLTDDDRKRTQEIMREYAEDCGVSWPRPIAVSERLPDGRGLVFVCYDHRVKPYDGNYPERGWGMGYYQGWAGWVITHPRTYPGAYVTHWLELPPNPE